MAIYIKGVELPKDDDYTVLTVYADGNVYYRTQNERKEVFTEAVYIPEPHDRLLDANKIFNDEKLCYGVACEECQFLYKTENILESCCKVERMIKDSPTVIEGSE